MDNHTPPTESALEKYQHEPLPIGRAIRLLKIDNREDQLSLQIQTFASSELPLYKALSYTWGKAICEDPDLDDLCGPGSIHEIRVNNRPFDIGENLFNALIQLQTEEVGWIWIDAICIDQTNLKERSSQVLLMGEIYSQAIQVVVWLGNDTQDIDAILWAQDFFYENFGEGDAQLGGIDERILQALDYDVERWKNFGKSMDRFFRRRRWFRRVWVFQETVLARRIELRNGQTLLDWNRLSLIAIVGGISGQPVPSVREFLTMSSAGHPRNQHQEAKDQKKRQIQAERYALRTDPQHWYCHLLQLVTGLKNFKASCAHDMIYATLGLARRFTVTDAIEPIVPDYASSWENVFVAFTTLLLEQLPSLLPLSHAEYLGPGRSPSLPSWCPDYRFSSSAPLISAGVVQPNLQLFSASGPTRVSEATNYIRGETLSVNGKRIDNIIAQSTGSWVQILSDSWLDAIDSCLEVCAKLPTNYLLNGQDRLEVLWRTMVVDQYIEDVKLQHHPAPEDLSVNFLAWLTQILAYQWKEVVHGSEETTRSPEFVQRIDRFVQRVNSWNKTFESSLLRLPTPERISEWADQISMENDIRDHPANITKVDEFLLGSGTGAGVWGVGRCLFRTSQHHMLGLGPEKLEVGDEVWLLKEAFVPFVLRPQPNGQYTLIGEAYVHGIMHGEWLNHPNGQDEFKPLEIV